MQLDLSPLGTLRKAVESFEPYLQASGELHDPLFNEPTQYGTAYYAFCNAVLAERVPQQLAYLKNAFQGIDAALAHVADTAVAANRSSFSRETGGGTRLNHRDFFWPAILKSFLILRRLDPSRTEEIATRISAIDIEKSFRTRPPSNWAMVWLSGEWLRIREGLSPLTLERFDDWLGIFFEGDIIDELGFYQEPGHSNSYDLFTRFHLAEMVVEGYSGRWRERAENLMRTGLQRSLSMQLSDGSMASAHRSTGQTWTIGVQVAYFTRAAKFFASSDPDLAREAAAHARRAFASFRRYQRAEDVFSPVENCLPMTERVGYESYTADGHYAPLAMGFLSMAIASGFEDGEIPMRTAIVRIENDPTFRSICHKGDYSLHFNAFPAEGYDAFGLVDLTFGHGRMFQFVSSVRHLPSGKLYNIGMALRRNRGEDIQPICAWAHALAEPVEALATGFRVSSRPRGLSSLYRVEATIEEKGMAIRESLENNGDPKSLLIPFLLDAGNGVVTKIEQSERMIRFVHGNEVIAFQFEAGIERIIPLTGGFENRRGRCGLVRVDLEGSSPSLSYKILKLQ